MKTLPGWGISTPPDFGDGGREILLYPIMYRNMR